MNRHCTFSQPQPSCIVRFWMRDGLNRSMQMMSRCGLLPVRIRMTRNPRRRLPPWAEQLS